MAAWNIPSDASFTWGPEDNYDNAVRLGDVNGDGLTDLVQSYGTNSSKHRVWLNNGAGWSLAPSGPGPDQRSRQTADSDRVMRYSDPSPFPATSFYPLRLID